MVRPLGNLRVSTVSGRAPMAVVVAYLTEGNLPLTAFVQEAPTEEVYSNLNIGGSFVDVEFTMENFNYSEQRPSDGGGIRRRTIAFGLRKLGDNVASGPFTSDITANLESSGDKFLYIWRQLYTGGVSRDDLYFRAFLVDRSNQFKDIELGFELGTYRIESGTSWNESSELTNISLVDAMLVEDSRVGASDENIDDTLYIYNPWFKGDTIPKTYGMIPRVRMLNSFPSVDTRSLASAFSGNFPSAYGTGTSDIQLVDSVDFGHPTLQLAINGAKVRIKTATGEVIRGNLRWDSGPKEIWLENVERNVHYATGQSYTQNNDGQLPENWGLNKTPPISFSLRKLMVINARAIIQAANGWAQAGVINFFDAGEPDLKVSPTDVNFQLEGFGDVEDEVRHAAINHPSFPGSFTSSSVSLNWSTSQSENLAPFTLTGYGNNLYFNNTYRELKFFFVDPDIGAVPGNSSDAWVVVAIDDLNVDYDCYLKDGFSSFNNDHLYAEGDGRLTKIPTGEVTSVTTSVSAFGASGLVRVRLARPPLEMGIGATSNIVYIDALYRAGSDARPEAVFNQIIKQEASFLDTRRHSSLATSWTASTWMPYIGYVARAEETVTELIDRICYQTGATLTWKEGKVALEQVVVPKNRFSEDDGNRKLKALFRIDDQQMLLDESASFDVGRLETLTETEEDMSENVKRFEYRAMFYDIGFGAWEDPFSPNTKGQNNRTIPRGYYRYDYHFDLINDVSSAKFAASQTLTAGHPSGFATVERTFKFNMDLYGLQYYVNQRIELADFPFFTLPLPTADSRPGLDAGQFIYPIPISGREYLLNGFCVVDSVVLDMSIEDYTLTVTAKMAQPFTEAVVSFISGALLVAPNQPPTPPNNPDDVPGGGGNYHTFPSIGPKTWELEITDDGPLVGPDITVDVDLVTEDDFNNGFTMTVSTTETGVTGGGTHTVSDGSNEGTPVSSNIQFTVPPEWFDGVSPRTFTIQFEVVYNSGLTVDFIEQIELEVGLPPDITAS